jgi:hypothetical protein
MRRGLVQGHKGEITRSGVTGMPIVHLGTTITTDTVRELADDQ